MTNVVTDDAVDNPSMNVTRSAQNMEMTTSHFSQLHLRVMQWVDVLILNVVGMCKCTKLFIVLNDVFKWKQGYA